MKAIHGCCSNSWFGLLLVVVGLYYLARSAGWIVGDFPFWAILGIVVGSYILLNGTCAPRKK